MLDPPVATGAISAMWDWTDWQTWATVVIFGWLWGILADLTVLKKLTPCGKPIAALFSAGLIVSLGIVTRDEALDCIEMGTILTLFGLFVILEFLETLGLVKALTDIVLSGRPTPVWILVRISVLSGVMAALIMNDGAAVFLSKVVLQICERERLPKTPFMLALATSANIGSAGTVLGNPKNMVIHAKTGISFVAFASKMLLPAFVGVALNTGLIVAFYYKDLRDYSPTPHQHDREVNLHKLPPDERTSLLQPEEDRKTAVYTNRYNDQQSPTTVLAIVDSIPLEKEAEELEIGSTMHMPALSRARSVSAQFGPQVLPVQPFLQTKKSTFMNVTVCITLMYAAFLMPGMSMGWSTVLCATAILVIEQIPPDPILNKVNFTLLFYIIALFVTIEAINKTPLPQACWTFVEPVILSENVFYSTAGFCALVLLICTVFTSIPCVLIIAPHLVELTGPLSQCSWLLLGLCVTLCGNITPTSSIAGYIVSDTVAQADPDKPITAWTWMKFSFPSTLIVLAVGATLLVAETTGLI